MVRYLCHWHPEREDNVSVVQTEMLDVPREQTAVYVLGLILHAGKPLHVPL